MSWHFRKTESPQTEKSFSYYNLLSQPMCPRRMKDLSVKAPALKDLLDKPLDLGCLELIEQTLRDAGVREANWSSDLGDVLRSLKPHVSGSSPQQVLDLLVLLHESSNEKTHKMDLDVTVTLEQVAAARNACGRSSASSSCA